MKKNYFITLALCFNLISFLHAQTGTDVAIHVNGILQVINPGTIAIDSAIKAVNKSSGAENVFDFKASYKKMITAIDDTKKIYKNCEELYKPFEEIMNTSSCNEAVDSYIRSKDLILQAINQCKQIVINADKILAEETVGKMKTFNIKLLADIADLKEKQLNSIDLLNSISTQAKDCD